jgi:hypothetical protein
MGMHLERTESETRKDWLEKNTLLRFIVVLFTDLVIQHSQFHSHCLNCREKASENGRKDSPMTSVLKFASGSLAPNCRKTKR